MSRFEAHNARAAAKAEFVFAEAFTIAPRRVVSSVNSRSSVDPTRAVATFNAIYHDYFSRADMKDGGSARALTSSTAANLATPAGHTSARARIIIHSDRLPYRPQPGDYVTRIGTGDVFRVAEVRHMSERELTVDLNIIEGEP